MVGHAHIFAIFAVQETSLSLLVKNVLSYEVLSAECVKLHFYFMSLYSTSRLLVVNSV